jgi:hypothetical protein
MPLNYGALGFSDKQNQMFQDAEIAIEKSDLFEWLSNTGPVDYSKLICEEIDRIGHHMKYKHTPESFNETMTEMQKLASMGIDAYCSLYTVAFPIPSAPKQVVQRTAEMDAKVINEIINRPPFKRAPKWSQEYVTAHPAVLRMLPKLDVSVPACMHI